MSLSILQPQPTEAAPYVVKDYPWGFRLRTEQRQWVETTKNGQRWVSQTLDPRSGRWCKPHRSTYSQILLLGLDEKGHVSSATFSAAYSTPEQAKSFRSSYGAYLSDYQTKELGNIEGILTAWSKVEFTVRTQKYRVRETGEILTQVPMHLLSHVVPVNDLGDAIDEQAEKDIDRDITRAVNIMGLKEAAKTSSLKDALDTLKRS